MVLAKTVAHEYNTARARYSQIRLPFRPACERVGRMYMTKSSSLTDLQESTGFFDGLVKQVRLAWRVLKDQRVPAWVKLIPVAGLIYLLSPIDLIPDMMLPGLGELDDVAVLILAVKLFLDMSPAGVVSEHIENLFGQGTSTSSDSSTSEAYIDASYRVMDSEE